MSENAASDKAVVSDGITEGLEIYQVGGSVRDALLGLPVTDHDYVVVGSNPQVMIARGFRSVGQDFPVFLHPKTHEEYALARLERKQGHGYHGFVFDTSPEVTLEEDLSRRDLTINAMALDADGQLIDPYHGRLDLAQGILRHVSEAFSEDPVRVLRLARFATRFSEFSVAPKTLELCHQMHASGELQHLVSERVWTEMAKALLLSEPSRFFVVLHETHALMDVWPQMHEQMGASTMHHALQALDGRARKADDVSSVELALRFALLCQGLSTPAIEASCERLQPPKVCRFWAQWASTQLRMLPQLLDTTPVEVLNFIQSYDGLRQPKRLSQVLALAEAWFDEQSATRAIADVGEFLSQVSEKISQIDTASLRAQGLVGPEMGQAMSDARIAVVESVKVGF